jgi:hypothetical protein
MDEFGVEMSRARAHIYVHSRLSDVFDSCSASKSNDLTRQLELGYPHHEVLGSKFPKGAQAWAPGRVELEAL